MTDGPRCPTCGTAVQPDWDWCRACGFDPEGLRPAGWAAQPAPTQPPSPPFEASAAPWQSAQRQAHDPGGSGPGVVTVIVAVLVGLALIGGVAFFTVGRRVVRTVVATKAGAGAQDPVAVTAPDGTFTVSVSGPATLRDESMSDGGTVHTFGWDGGPNGQFVAYFDLPAAPPPDGVAALLTGGIDTMVDGQGTSVPGTFAGHDALTFSSHGPTAMTGVAFMDGPRLYVLAAAGPYAANQPQARAFLDSFHLNP